MVVPAEAPWPLAPGLLFPAGVLLDDGLQRSRFGLTGDAGADGLLRPQGRCAQHEDEPDGAEADGRARTDDRRYRPKNLLHSNPRSRYSEGSP
jgi:hypothetical protein